MIAVPKSSGIKRYSNHCAGLRSKELIIKDGFKVKQHTHTFDHMSVLAKGCAIVRNGEEQASYYAPAIIPIKAGTQHSFEAINGDVTVLCVHRTDCEDENEIDNVLIEKTIFDKIRFNEELKQYGHEDTLFGYQLKKAGIDILHIDNGLVHGGVEANRDFLNKTKLGIENLSKLYDNVTDKKAFSETVRMLRLYNKLRHFRITRILAGIFIRYRDKKTPGKPGVAVSPIDLNLT